MKQKLQEAKKENWEISTQTLMNDFNMGNTINL